MQAGSGSDSDSECWNENEEIIPVNRLTPTVCTDQPEPATTIRTCTVKQWTFFAPTGAVSRNRSRNLNLRTLSPETGYSDRIFVVFIISMLSSTSFRNSYPLFIPSFDAGSFSTILNKQPISYIKAIFGGSSTE